MMMYNLWYSVLIGYYKKINYHRSLPYALDKERDWQANKPDDDDDELWGDDDDEEDDEEEGADEEGGDDEEE